MRIVNLTPHPVTIAGLVIPPEPTAARCAVVAAPLPPLVVDGVEVPQEATSFGEVFGLSAPCPDVVYVVSRPVAEALPGRTDLRVPHKPIKDLGPPCDHCGRSEGKIVGSGALAQIVPAGQPPAIVPLWMDDKNHVWTESVGGEGYYVDVSMFGERHPKLPESAFQIEAEDVPMAVRNDHTIIDHDLGELELPEDQHVTMQAALALILPNPEQARRRYHVARKVMANAARMMDINADQTSTMMHHVAAETYIEALFRVAASYVEAQRGADMRNTLLRFILWELETVDQQLDHAVDAAPDLRWHRRNWLVYLAVALAAGRPTHDPFGSGPYRAGFEWDPTNTRPALATIEMRDDNDYRNPKVAAWHLPAGPPWAGLTNGDKVRLIRRSAQLYPV